MTSTPKLYSPSNKQECQAAVRRLSREKVISIDAEGVQLGKDGPLTLLQIGTLDGTVYLFDVMINEKKQDKKFFTETGLVAILTSTAIVKVIQSCSGDSAALYHQFGIRLENVFDTQVAHLVIEEHKGRQLPTREKLGDICKLYSENAEVYEGKAEVKLEWCKVAGNYWAKRPMTKEMIDYASGDVTALIPEVYETQNRYLEKNGRLDLFAERVQEEIEFNIDPVFKERRKERNFKIKMAILDKMANKYRRQTDFTSITDEDEIKALNDTNVAEMSDLPDVIQELKRQSMASFLRSITEKLETPETFNPDRGLTYKFHDIEHCGSEQLQKEATRIKQEVNKVVIGDVQTKYSADTPLENISSLEYHIIRGFKSLSEDAQRHHPTVLALHWKIAEKELADATDELKADPNYNMMIPIPKLRFYTNNPDVPRNTKRLAQELLNKQESTILQIIPQKYTRNAKANDLTDSERMILGGLRLSSGTYDPVIVDLYWKIAEKELTDATDELKADSNYKMTIPFSKLRFYTKNPDVPTNTKTLAQELLEKHESAILQKIPQKYSRNAKADDLTESERLILGGLRLSSGTNDPVIVVLYWKITEKELTDATDELKVDPNYNMTIPFSRLKFYTNNPDVPWNTKTLAQELLEKYEYAILQKIQQKYTRDAITDDLTDSERMILGGLRLSSGTYDPVIVALYWKIAEKELTDASDGLKSDPNYNMTIPFSKLRFYANNPDVPRNTKSLAQELLEKHESAILQKIQQKYTRNAAKDDLTDSERMILGGLRISSGTYDPVIVALYWKIADKELTDATDGLKADPNYNMTIPFSKLRFYANNPNVPRNTKTLAHELLRKHESTILQKIPQKYTRNATIDDLTDSERIILAGLRLSPGTYDPVIVALYRKIAEKDLTEATDGLKADSNYSMNIPFSKLRFYANNPNVPRNIKALAQELLKKYESAILQKIQQKYTRNATIDDLTDSERMILGGLRLSSGNCHPVVVVDLYWKLALRNLDKDLADYRAGTLPVNDGFRRKLDFYIRKRTVPSDVKQRAKEFLQALPQTSRGGGRKEIFNTDFRCKMSSTLQRDVSGDLYGNP